MSLQRSQGIDDLWPGVKPVIGVVHLRPLPGSPRWSGSMAEVEDRAIEDADALGLGGVDGVLIENYGDAPFLASAVPPETVASMSRVVRAVGRIVRVPLGVNVLRNDPQAALAIAVAAGASFIRVNVHTGVMWTDQGAVEGNAAATLRMRARLGKDVAVLADVLVKHAVAPPGFALENVAADTWERGLADALIVTGPGTGRAADPDDVAAVRGGAPEATVLVGSGVTPGTVAATLKLADGVIVGTALTNEGRAGSGIDPGQVSALMEAARG